MNSKVIYKNAKTELPSLGRHCHIITVFGEKTYAYFKGEYWLKYRPAHWQGEEKRYELKEVACWS